MQHILIDPVLLCVNSLIHLTMYVLIVCRFLAICFIHYIDILATSLTAHSQITYRGRYIEGDVIKYLRFHPWGIEFKSQDVKLKEAALNGLDKFDLPVSIAFAYLKLLHLKITYTLHIDVHIRGLFLQIGPHKHSNKPVDPPSRSSPDFGVFPVSIDGVIHQIKSQIRPKAIKLQQSVLQYLVPTELSLIAIIILIEFCIQYLLQSCNSWTHLISVYFTRVFLPICISLLLFLHLWRKLSNDSNPNHYQIAPEPRKKPNRFEIQSNIKKRSLLQRAESRMLMTEWQFLRSSMSLGKRLMDTISNLILWTAKYFIRNTKVTVSDIHIRYEDVYSIQNKRFVLGVTVKNIQIKSNMDIHHIMADDGDLIHKQDGLYAKDGDSQLSQEHDTVIERMEIKALSVYNDITKIKPINVSSDYMGPAQFANIPWRKLRCPGYEYILKTLSFGFDVRLHGDSRFVQCTVSSNCQ